MKKQNVILIRNFKINNVNFVNKTVLVNFNKTKNQEF